MPEGYVQVGGKRVSVTVARDVGLVAIQYELVAQDETKLGGGWRVAVDIQALEAIAKQHGGAPDMSDEKLVELASVIFPALKVASFHRSQVAGS